MLGFKNLTCNDLHVKLSNFRSNEKYCDIKIQVQDKTFLCHQLLLASVSPFFDSMFEKNFEEGIVEISLPDIEIAAFEDVRESLYKEPQFNADVDEKTRNFFPDYKYLSTCYEMHSKLSCFHSRNKYCDVNVNVQGKVFPCHRVLLASASSDFDAILSEKSSDRKTRELSLPDIDVATFENVLEFAYEGRQPEITELNVCNLLRVSTYLKIQKIKNSCVYDIKRQFDIEHSLYSYEKAYAISSAIKLYILLCSNDATDRDGKSLKETMTDYIVMHFYRICQDDAFLELLFDDFHTILKRIRFQKSAHHSVPFKDDDVLLDVIIRWVLHSGEERRAYFQELAKFVNFKRVSVEYAKSVLNEYGINKDPILKEQFFHSTAEKTISLQMCVDFLDFTMKSNLQFSDNQNDRPAAYQAENKKALYAYFSDDEEEELKVITVNKYHPEWFLAYSMDYKDNDYSYESKWQWFAPDDSEWLYCIKDGRTFCAYTSIDVSSTSRTLTPPPIRFTDVQACTIQNTNNMYLYCPSINFTKGGITNPKYAKKKKTTITDEESRRGIYSYNCDLDSWFPVPQMKANMNYACMTADDKLIYLIGGQQLQPWNQRKGYAQAYDPRSPRWFDLPKTNNYFTLSGCCILDGRIYVSNCKAAEVFHPTAGKWETLFDKKVQTNVAKVVSYENLIWIINMEEYGKLTIINPNEYCTITQKENMFVYPTSNSLVSGFMKESMDPEHQRIQHIVVFKNYDL